MGRKKNDRYKPGSFPAINDEACFVLDRNRRFIYIETKTQNVREEKSEQ